MPGVYEKARATTLSIAKSTLPTAETKRKEGGRRRGRRTEAEDGGEERGGPPLTSVSAATLALLMRETRMPPHTCSDLRAWPEKLGNSPRPGASTVHQQAATTGETQEGAGAVPSRRRRSMHPHASASGHTGAHRSPTSSEGQPPRGEERPTANKRSGKGERSGRDETTTTTTTNEGDDSRRDRFVPQGQNKKRRVETNNPKHPAT